MPSVITIPNYDDPYIFLERLTLIFLFSACLNFLKLCKMKYYNLHLIYSVERNFIAQTGDPSASGHGGMTLVFFFCLLKIAFVLIYNLDVYWYLNSLVNISFHKILVSLEDQSQLRVYSNMHYEKSYSFPCMPCVFICIYFLIYLFICIFL